MPPGPFLPLPDPDLCTMTIADVAFVPELAAHDAEIEEINAEAFGPGRFTRAAYKNLGIGKKLVAIALEEARRAGWSLVILVGDAPYYAPLGFDIVVPRGQVTMPRPVDPGRLLAAELASGALENFRGDVVHVDQAKTTASETRPQRSVA